ncbi:MAG: exo-alpha-sialidase, partial [Clostridia bacterium]|nr:exo-alpha-sialidase [Clostridia bacterium]
MKIDIIGEPQIIMSNPESRHNYFGWPTAARLQNGKIAVVASGFRLRHVCPFGKMVIAYSEDDGKTYTSPAPVIDTVLDDRDGGIVPFGESGVIVTSFNNTVQFQRDCAKSAYDRAYLDTVTPEAEQKALGVTFRISTDGGVTFGPIHKSPVTSPHGTTVLKDGTILWVGRLHCGHHDYMPETDFCEVYRIGLDGSCTFVGRLPEIYNDEEKLT